jgi:DNA primase
LASFDREFILQVLAANDIVDVISAYVDLKPAGTDRFVGLSPFQNERTPSFSVTRSKQAYYCFSTDQGGDLITFLEKVEGLTFVEAVERLAERAGIAMPAASAYDKREDFERKQVAELGAFALAHYRGVLADPIRGGEGRRYLESRNFQPETIKKFALGYAPEAANGFIDAARAAKYNDRILEISGLARRSDRGGGLYSFFRNRLMFPIRDTSGRVVAFGGRDITGEAKGKYINSPENIVYKKGRTLYGLYEGREAMRREKRALLVEGYFDVMRCHEAGVEQVVATCGTALTPEQAKLIRRYAEEVTILYDGDAAGIRAATRGVAILMGAGLGVTIVTLPKGADPDDYIQEAGVEAFRAQLETARDFVSYYAEVSADRLESIEGRNEIAKEMFAVLQEMNDPLRQDAYLQHIAKVLKLNEHSVRQAYGRVAQRQSRRQAIRTENDEAPAAKATYRSFLVSPDDAIFVSDMLAHDAVRAMVETALEDSWSPSGTPFDEVVAAIVDAGSGPIDLSAMSERARTLYAAAATAEARDERLALDDAAMRINRLKRESLTAEGRRLEEAIRKANDAQDMVQVIQLSQRRLELRRQIDAVGAL